MSEIFKQLKVERLWESSTRPGKAELKLWFQTVPLLQDHIHVLDNNTQYTQKHIVQHFCHPTHAVLCLFLKLFQRQINRPGGFTVNLALWYGKPSAGL